MTRQDSARILVVDDDEAHRLMLRTLLEEWHYGVVDAEDGVRTLEVVRRGGIDLVLMDMRMPRMDGIEATRQIAGYNPALPIIIMTAYSSIPTAIEALKSGAFDYITKPLDFDALKLIMERALKHTRLERENEALKQQLARIRVPQMLGRSPAMEQLLETIALVAPSEATVLITGESGTGKGLVARVIHANSSRAQMPLVEVNCAAMPETLMESELFGHEKGAFTGANRERKGRFVQADRGSLFLDEVGELNSSMQAKLLRVLQDGEVQRVGSDKSIPVDVRVLAATNRKLDEMVSEGTFREDLFYRLNVVAIEVPPLRARVEDIPVLAKHFWEIFAQKNHKPIAGMTPRAMDLLLRHHWPGNVRELENVMERAVILLRGEYLSEEELPLGIQKLGREDEPLRGLDKAALARPGTTLADMEKQLIAQSLKDAGGNKSETARRLGITRRTLQLKLKKYFGEPDEDEGPDMPSQE